MKRITLIVDDDGLYRDIKVAAAHEGRLVKDVVLEALSEWLRGRVGSEVDKRRKRELEALENLKRLRESLPLTETVLDTLDEIRMERS